MLLSVIKLPTFSWKLLGIRFRSCNLRLVIQVILKKWSFDSFGQAKLTNTRLCNMAHFLLSGWHQQWHHIKKNLYVSKAQFGIYYHSKLLSYTAVNGFLIFFYHTVSTLFSLRLENSVPTGWVKPRGCGYEIPMIY